MNDNEKRKEYPKAFAAVCKDNDIKMDSRSGGVFTLLSNEILKDNGVIYGCILDDNLEAIHIRTTEVDMRNKMRGSKYVQSNLKNTFKECKEDLLKDRKVMYVGTPCQIAGIRRYLQGINTDKLLLVDILCHGVPSPKLFREYVRHFEKQKHGKMSKFEFREKNIFGWYSHYEMATINKKQYPSYQYANMFLSDKAMRPSCYKCRYRNLEREGDITLGDFWGIRNTYPEIDDNKGVSLVLVNSNKGMEVYNKVEAELINKECTIPQCMQASLNNVGLNSEGRTEFFKLLNKGKIRKILYKYGETGFKNFLRQRVRILIKKNRG